MGEPGSTSLDKTCHQHERAELLALLHPELRSSVDKGIAMKHLLLLLLAWVVAYACWQCLPAARRDRLKKIGTRHAIRLGTVVALLFALLVIAYYTHSTRIL
jgi:hypothetical protein